MHVYIHNVCRRDQMFVRMLPMKTTNTTEKTVFSYAHTSQSGATMRTQTNQVLQCAHKPMRCYRAHTSQSGASVRTHKSIRCYRAYTSESDATVLNMNTKQIVLTYEKYLKLSIVPFQKRYTILQNRLVTVTSRSGDQMVLVVLLN